MPAAKKGKSLSKKPGALGIGTAAGIPVSTYTVLGLTVGLIVVVILGHIIVKFFA